MIRIRKLLRVLAAKKVKRHRLRKNIGAPCSALLLVFALAICRAASSAPRDPVFSVPSGTSFNSPHQVAIAVPHNGQVFLTRDGTTPSTSSTLYTGPLTVRWPETIKAIAVVGVSTSNVVTANYSMSSTKYPQPSAGGTSAPTINLNHPVTGQ